jgi:hypothetical protein
MSNFMHNSVIPTGAKRSERSGGACFLFRYRRAHVSIVSAAGLCLTTLTQFTNTMRGRR